MDVIIVHEESNIVTWVSPVLAFQGQFYYPKWVQFSLIPCIDAINGKEKCMLLLLF